MNEDLKTGLIVLGVLVLFKLVVEPQLEKMSHAEGDDDYE